MAGQLNPAFYTVRNIIDEALDEAGAFGQGQSPQDRDIDQAAVRLQRMLQNWSADNITALRTQTLGAMSNGQLYYKIGPGQSFDTGTAPRPDRLLAAFARRGGLGPTDVVYPQPPLTAIVEGIGQMGIGIGAIGGTRFVQGPAPVPTPPVLPGTQTIDSPVKIITAIYEWNDTRLKSLGTIPTALWYDPKFPNGEIYPWPVPPATQWSLFVSFLVPLPWQFLNTATFLVMPPVYYPAVMLNLAVALRRLYRIPGFPGDTLPAAAADARRTMTRALYQVPKLVMPRELKRRGRYNIITDDGG